MSGINIRGFVLFNGAASQGFAQIVQKGAPTGQFLKSGDPLIFAIDLTNFSDATAVFTGVAVTDVEIGPTIFSGFYLYQSTPSDLTTHRYLGVFGVGPAG